jgi:hypothetical protein
MLVPIRVTGLLTFNMYRSFLNWLRVAANHSFIQFDIATTREELTRGQTNTPTGVLIMDTSFAIRVDANTQQWHGKKSPQDDRHKRRGHHLQVLLEKLKAGELDAARQAFVALVNCDPSLSADPYVNHIGTALQSSNLYAAQHFGLKLLNRGGHLQSLASETASKAGNTVEDTPDNNHGFVRVDLSA